jgi:hypothetical protein
MIFTISDNVHNWAKAREEFSNSRTIKDDDDPSGRYVGALTEFALSNFLAVNSIPHECVGRVIHDYDIISGIWTMDAKAKARTYTYTDRTDRIPKDECHVKEDQEGFNCHIYVFSSVCVPIPKGRAVSVQIMGWCTKKEYWDSCYRVKKGDTDGKFTEDADAGKLLYASLEPMSDLVDKLHEHQTRARFPVG